MQKKKKKKKSGQVCFFRVTSGIALVALSLDAIKCAHDVSGQHNKFATVKRPTTTNSL